jgi:hypothetical protein
MNLCLPPLPDDPDNSTLNFNAAAHKNTKMNIQLKYAKLIKKMEMMGKKRYMSDPIGKCMREKGRFMRKNARIDNALKASKTFKAAEAGSEEWKKFSERCATRAVLIWSTLPSDDNKKTGRPNAYKKSASLEILIDAKSRIIRKAQPNQNGFVFGFLDDVEGCIFSPESSALYF